MPNRRTPVPPPAGSSVAVPHEHHLTVARTARYATLGAPGPATRELWIVLHGHGQLAARFLRYFGTLDDGSRWLVAPEALSRYYLDPLADRTHPERRVGATWMTREDRLSEINDHVGYLDALHAHLVRQLPARAGVTLRVLGFSQGVATACRWIAASAVQPAHLVLWGGLIPADVDLATGAPGRRIAAARLTLVVGREDEYADAAVVAAQAERLARHDVTFDALGFDGGHRMDLETLRAVAALPAHAAPGAAASDAAAEADA